MYEYVKEDEWVAWKKSRHETCSSKSGWLSLWGLHWVHRDKNSIGFHPSKCDVVLEPDEGLPEVIGEAIVTKSGEDYDVKYECCCGECSVLDGTIKRQISNLSFSNVSNDDQPIVIYFRQFSFLFMVRNKKVAVRVKNEDSPVLKSFKVSNVSVIIIFFWNDAFSRAWNTFHFQKDSLLKDALSHIQIVPSRSFL